MSAPTLIAGEQSEALAREIEQQFDAECRAATAEADAEAKAIVAQARTTARMKMHEAIADLRRDGAQRIARARAQRETEERGLAQRQAARAIAEALPRLREALDARWMDAGHRKTWTDSAARVAAERLRPDGWLVEHPADWSAAEQQAFAAAIGTAAGGGLRFQPDSTLSAGVRIVANEATLDATPRGLLADERTIAALLLAEIAAGDTGAGAGKAGEGEARDE